MHKKSKTLPTIERIREALDYDPLTGVMTTRIQRSNSSKAGERVGSDGKQGYLIVGLDHHRILLHRLAWAHYYGEWPKLVVDHIDGNGHNNAIANLRDATHRENSANTLRHKTMRSDAAKWRAHQDSLTPVTVDQAIDALVTALAESKGWMRDYADAIIRDAIDRRDGPDAEAIRREALEEAARLCEWRAHAIDGGGNAYLRSRDALNCALAIRALAAPGERNG